MIEHILLWQFTEQAKRGAKAGVFAAAVCRIARAD